MLAMKIAQTHYQLSGNGHVFGLYMNTNTLTEPRHFLMALIDTLSLPPLLALTQIVLNRFLNVRWQQRPTPDRA